LTGHEQHPVPGPQAGGQTYPCPLHGEYEWFGTQVVSQGQILFDTVCRFKGQQEAAVILVDVDPCETGFQQELQVLFCGMTRTTVRLELV